MWVTFRRFIGNRRTLATLSFGSHYQMADAVLQMYLDSETFSFMFRHRILRGSEKLFLIPSFMSNKRLSFQKVTPAILTF